MTPQEEKEFKETLSRDCRRMTRKLILTWGSLSEYLDTEHEDGKTEFRLVVNADKTFYVHPLGKDGKTFDGKL